MRFQFFSEQSWRYSSSFILVFLLFFLSLTFFLTSLESLWNKMSQMKFSTDKQNFFQNNFNSTCCFHLKSLQVLQISLQKVQKCLNKERCRNLFLESFLPLHAVTVFHHSNGIQFEFLNFLSSKTVSNFSKRVAINVEYAVWMVASR